MAGTAEGAAKARARREAAKRQAARVNHATAEFAAAQGQPEAPEGLKRYIVAKKPLLDGEKVYKPGDVYPKAHLLPRLESWLRTGRLIEA